MTAPPRSLSQRTTDTRARLATDVDCWVASADGSGTPYLVPLSFRWDGTTILLSTGATTPTARNLLRSGWVRIGLGPTRDVVLVEGRVRDIPAGELPTEVGDAFAAKTGFDPRVLTSPYVYLEVRPTRIQAWREENELAGRDVMRDAQWLSG